MGLLDCLLRWISWLWYGNENCNLEAGERGLSRSGRWSTTRKEHIKKEPNCQWCGTRWALEVHHVVPFHVDPARENDPSNLITLCEVPGRCCHFHEGHLGNFKTYNVDVRRECERKSKEL